MDKNELISRHKKLFAELIGLELEYANKVSPFQPGDIITDGKIIATVERLFQIIITS